jgi:murein DD-endopeptidase MepM/ murein hydrolase activator NlpD
MRRPTLTVVKFLISLLLIAGFISICALTAWIYYTTLKPVTGNPNETAIVQEENSSIRNPAALPTQLSLTPTPDAPHSLPALRQKAETYVVQPGDSLNQIAQRYMVTVNNIVEANQISQPDFLEVGQTLIIPPPKPVGVGPSFKIIPDSELVYGPGSADFDLAKFVHEKGGFLSKYREKIDDRNLSGIKIVERVAQEFSVNPRLLLAILEYQSGWLTKAEPSEESKEYPLGIQDEWRKGLYRQLTWAANSLNQGYYLWRVNGLAVWSLADDNLIKIDPTINAGTVGVQQLYAQILGRKDWETAVGPQGIAATYTSLFGYPFAYPSEPIVPDNLTQPEMQLPFEKGKTWSFTGGPHGGWGSGSAWAAIDFAPPGEALGCFESDAWVVAVADGLIVRSENGAVIQDLDADGIEQTGWTILYMHLAPQGRVRAGTYIKAGQQIGHPSCEGGVSTGTHLHLARRYNGEWIPADQSVPFVLDGWVSSGFGSEYDGSLNKGNSSVEAWEGRRPDNAIRR